MNEALIRVRELELDYPSSGRGSTFSLHVPHLDVYRHETLTLIGHNGSGKSSLLRVLSLLTRPARGTVEFGSELEPGGEASTRRSSRALELRRRMASVLQQPLLCRMSVFQNVAVGLRFRKLPRPEIEARVTTWLRRLRIDHLRDRDARSLSGGEAQRASIARAMVLEPDVLFLDEPFSALDPPSRHALIDEFQPILAQTRTTTVFATHDRGEALALSDRIAVLERGRIEQWGSAEEVFTQPASEGVARFVGAATLIPGEVRNIEDGLLHIEAHVGTIGAKLVVLGEGAVGERITVCVRPEHVILSPAASHSATSARNVLRGEVERITRTGTGFRVVVDCGLPVVATVTESARRDLALEVGAKVAASFKATAAHTIRRGPGSVSDSSPGSESDAGAQ